MNGKRIKTMLIFLSAALAASLFLFAGSAYASINVSIGTPGNNAELADSIQILFLLSIIALSPTILIMFTSFTRYIISLHFMRSALGTQQMPPNQILVGLALFLTFFTMSPVLTDINENALKPLSDGTIGVEEAFQEGMEPLRVYMLRQVEPQDISLFYQLSGMQVTAYEDTPNRVLLPAFVLGELTKGFKLGFAIFLPFLVIDMVVASTLMAMGMMMLPPAMISLPFKILLFTMVNGWSLFIESIFKTFN